MFLTLVPAILIATLSMGALIDFIMYDPVKSASLQSVAINLLERVQNAAEAKCKAICADGAVPLAAAMDVFQQNAAALKGSVGSISVNGNVISWFTYVAADKNSQLMSPSIKMSDATRSTLAQYSAQLAVAQGYQYHVASASGPGWTAPPMNLAIPAAAGIPDKAIIIASHR